MLRLDTDLLLKTAAEQGDHTHEEIAIRAGIDRSTVTRLLSGKIPSLPKVTALAWTYGLKLDDLVPRQPTASPVPA